MRWLVMVMRQSEKGGVIGAARTLREAKALGRGWMEKAGPLAPRSVFAHDVRSGAVRTITQTKERGNA